MKAGHHFFMALEAGAHHPAGEGPGEMVDFAWVSPSCPCALSPNSPGLLGINKPSAVRFPEATGWTA